MVKQIETQTVISTKHIDVTSKPSLKRWLKHVLYFKSAKHALNTHDCDKIAETIAQAENGHRGEIQVIVEGSLPSHFALQHTTQQRAEYLFAKYRVWDTQYNSGVLIYLNLCEHAVEIVADRGIDGAVHETCWQEICQSMLPLFKAQQFGDGLCVAIEQLGQLFSQYYGNNTHDPEGNELSNRPRLI